jgi:RsiW-degrading membrane proteinase PrsW (M82 family)
MSVIIAVTPVLIFLALLQLMDSFKLVSAASVLRILAVGALVAVACLAVHAWIMQNTSIELTSFTRYLAPATEEFFKASVIAVLLWRGRVGFLVDAAVQGFAVGAGFALVENLDYLWHLENAPLVLWLVRGLGTAVLHGTTTAVFAIVTKALMQRRGRRVWLASLPGLALAIAIHSAFNHVVLPPLVMTALFLTILPLMMVLIFQQSERSTRDWIGGGLDLDVELLDLVRSEHFAATRFGGYLLELQKRFGGLVAADMFCLLRLDLEIVVQAKAKLLARDAGADVPVTEDVHATLREIAYLQHSIGRTGLLALKPLEMISDRDHWHRHLLSR